ncbi:MAG: aminoglycoside phosphotransferase family protein [Oscillospiraceae bacterium]|nr:aminoglycoside phosphotransferase family protein [Oscillospiraceae bacterium]
MLDLNWERYIPIIDIKPGELKSIFAEFDNTLAVTDFNAIRLGCQNSNFAVNTNKGKFLLRFVKTGGLNNEKIAFELVHDKINVPSLLFHTTKEYAEIFIYEYIDGVSLQKLIIENGQCEYPLLGQVAKAAAAIHNIPKEETAGLAAFDVPPYELWYDCFLDDGTARALIGEKMRERLRRLVSDKQKFISEINSYKSFIHCDFRPANMLADEHSQVFFVDWESAWRGHTLADIGQFFRYRRFFSDAHIELFEQVYNTYANRKLPGNWFELSLFRDLINPLQLLSSNQKAPLRNADLINIIEGALDYWGY